MPLCVCPCSPASVSGSALQTAHGDLQLCLPEEELHAALKLHSKELQPNAPSQVKRCCSVCEQIYMGTKKFAH